MFSLSAGDERERKLDLIGDPLALLSGRVDFALTEAVRRVAGDPDRREQCGRRARAYAEQFLDKDRILATFENQQTTLCGRKS